MFITDFKNDFYSQLIGKRVLLIVNYDLDAICASKIFQSLFRHDQITYSLVPIMGIVGLRRAFEEHKTNIKHVLLVNCGGTIDIVEVLEPDQDIVFYVCDSHRPLDVCNVYSDGQVRILSQTSTEENIPSFENLFRDSDDENSEDDENHENENEVEDLNRVERLQRSALKRQEKRRWENSRDNLMFEYTQYSYYGKSSAIQIFELAWRLSKDTIDLLWWAIVGITEQLVLGKIENTAYTLETERIQSHVTRLTNKQNEQTIQTSATIVFENDLHLALYRHWTVQESIRHSMYPACKLKLWTLRGEKRMHELLVDMGLPLAQARQTFTSMELVLRKEFFGMIEKLADKYDIPDIVYGSFTLQYGYRNRYAASDFVYAMLAKLESVGQDRTPELCFLDTLDSLARTNRQVLESGVSEAKVMLTAIFRQVQASLEAHQVHSAGPFLYLVLTEESQHFSSPYGLLMLAKFILRGHVAVSRNRRAPTLPLVASCPIDVERGLCLLVGVSPVGEDSPKNLFGKAFEQAAIKSDATVARDFFDTSLIQIRQSDLSRFLDALTVLLC